MFKFFTSLLLSSLILATSQAQAESLNPFEIASWLERAYTEIEQETVRFSGVLGTSYSNYDATPTICASRLRPGGANTDTVSLESMVYEPTDGNIFTTNVYLYSQYFASRSFIVLYDYRDNQREPNGDEDLRGADIDSLENITVSLNAPGAAVNIGSSSNMNNFETNYHGGTYTDYGPADLISYAGVVDLPASFDMHSLPVIKQNAFLGASALMLTMVAKYNGQIVGSQGLLFNSSPEAASFFKKDRCWKAQKVRW